MTQNQQINKKTLHNSLRTVLALWFLFFAIVPLFFFIGFSLKSFETAINFEFTQRLEGNVSEAKTIFEDFKFYLDRTSLSHISDSQLLFLLTKKSNLSISDLIYSWMPSNLAQRISVFNSNGQLTAAVLRNHQGQITKENIKKTDISMSEDLLKKISQKNKLSFVDFGNTKQIEFVIICKILSQSGNTIGFIEEVIAIDANFISNWKKRMKLDILFLNEKKQLQISSQEDFFNLPKNFFQSIEPSFNEISIRESSKGFLLKEISWGESKFYLGLVGSKKTAFMILDNVRNAFILVIIGIIIFITILILFISKKITLPLNKLFLAVENLEEGQEINLNFKNETEINFFTKKINQMSHKIVQVQKDLQFKIAELEQKNQEIRETQSRLVHSAKMVSLGQLVAGVAHELNNPIGFIYSNMTHLREYSEKLINIIRIAEANPAELEKTKQEYDYNYIVQDLPKLIQSCEDGSRRTKDIILGLRNFSRLEESQIKDVDLNQSIDNTLNLLSGEMKNRIKINKDYATIPNVNCYSGEINQVFMNLLTNAIQAIENEGEIWITTILTKWQDQDAVKISIRDSGYGMSPDIIDKIFDPFFTTKMIGKGTGLGLSISYGVIKKHGGDIEVKSSVGNGTEFQVYLPLAFVK